MIARTDSHTHSLPHRRDHSSALDPSRTRARIAALAIACLPLLGSPSTAAPAHAAPAVRPLAPEIAATNVREDTYPARRVAFPRGVTGLPDLTYRTLDGFRPLKLDLYLPKRGRRDALLPLVVYVHGGSWNSGHSRHSGPFAKFPDALAEFAARGYAVASVNYRLSGEARFPAAVQDVKAALRWLRTHAADYGIDPARAVIWGASAGGQIAALVGVSCGMPEFAPAPAPAPAQAQAGHERDDCVQGVVPWFGIFDLTNPPPMPPELAARMRAAFATTDAYLGCEYPAGCSTETLRLASARQLIAPGAPPFLMIHGERDRGVSAQQSRDFASALLAAGVEAEAFVIPDVDHGFIGATPEATRAANVLAMQKTLEFVARTIGPARTR